MSQLTDALHTDSSIDASESLARAISAIDSLQDAAGWWKGELETNVTMDAEDLLLRQFLGIRTDEETKEAAVWIRSQQREDGTWANFYGGPGDLSTTLEAYVALKLAGDKPEDPHMAQAAAFIRDQGGLERARVFTRIWMALFGLWSWDELPIMPPELIFLPPWIPLNVYDFACWARQTVVALTVVGARRPVRPIPIEINELRTGAPPLPLEPLTTLPGILRRIDALLHLYERRPIRTVRERALRLAERWILERQEADGSWGGIQPPWVYSLMALHCQGYALTHPVMRAALKGLDTFTIRDERGRHLEACQSPVWDTALAVVALRDAGVPTDDPRVVAAAQWLVDEEITVNGDWKIRRPALKPGGWAFEFENDNYPDIDDTAEVVLALVKSNAKDGGAIDRAVAWIEGMQCQDGGWAAFDVDNTRQLCRELPFCDFGELIDPPSADVTAHVVEMLAALDRFDDRLDRGVAWLLKNQEADGSWYGRWGANYIYGTGAVVPALVAAGLPTSHRSIRRAVDWLIAHQQENGGWGEDLRSYDDPSWHGRGATTASQTAWALLALLAAGERESDAVQRGVAYLIVTQRSDGTWDDPWYTGTGFPGFFYINYHLYRLVFPVTALGRYVRGTTNA